MTRRPPTRKAGSGSWVSSTGSKSVSPQQFSGRVSNGTRPFALPATVSHNSGAGYNSSMSGRTRLVGLLLFGSGFCALIYQTTWLREFRLIFGASTAATAAVIGVFMAGLGFGGIILGRRSETKAQPLAFYAKLELLIAASAGCSPVLVWAVRHLYIAVGGTATLGMFFGTVVR